MKISYLYIAIVSFLLCLVSCEQEDYQWNKNLTGHWEFNNKTEYIEFTEYDTFTMNDTINGVYEIQEEDDRNVWYYYEALGSEDDIYGSGEMILEYIDNNTISLFNMPLHENIKITLYKRR